MSPITCTKPTHFHSHDSRSICITHKRLFGRVCDLRMHIVMYQRSATIKKINHNIGRGFSREVCWCSRETSSYCLCSSKLLLGITRSMHVRHGYGWHHQRRELQGAHQSCCHQWRNALSHLCSRQVLFMCLSGSVLASSPIRASKR